MKKVLFVVCVLAIVLTCSQSFAAVKYWNGTTSGGVVSSGVVEGDGKWTATSAFPDGWSASTAVSTVRVSSPSARTKAAYNSTSGFGAFAEIEFYLGQAGYWDIAATQSTSSLGTPAIGVANVTGWVGLPATTTMFSTGNVWNSMGVFKTTVATPKIKFTEGTTTNRWYLDQIRLTAATPGIPTLTAFNPGDIALNWTAGNYSSFFDVYFGSTPNPTAKIGTNLTGTSVALPGGLAGTYYWKVVAKNVDMTASSVEGSFTAVPEPGTVAAALALLAPAGMMFRRRRD